MISLTHSERLPRANYTIVKRIYDVKHVGFIKWHLGFLRVIVVEMSPETKKNVIKFPIKYFFLNDFFFSFVKSLGLLCSQNLFKVVFEFT